MRTASGDRGTRRSVIPMSRLVLPLLSLALLVGTPLAAADPVIDAVSAALDEATTAYSGVRDTVAAHTGVPLPADDDDQGILCDIYRDCQEFYPLNEWP